MLHHHRLPDGPPSEVASQRARSVVGLPGMPSPAAKPSGRKRRFSPKDDELLVELKENREVSWKQIADFFPRSIVWHGIGPLSDEAQGKTYRCLTWLRCKSCRWRYKTTSRRNGVSWRTKLAVVSHLRLAERRQLSLQYIELSSSLNPDFSIVKSQSPRRSVLVPTNRKKL